MNKLAAFLFVLLVSQISFSQDFAENDKSLIKNLIVESFNEIWSKLESKNIEKYYTKDFLLLEHGEIWNNDTIANYLNKAKLRTPLPKRINTIEVIDIKVYNRVAWIAYHNYATFYVDDKIVRQAHWLESASVILTNDGWKLEMMHSTRMPKKE